MPPGPRKRRRRRRTESSPGFSASADESHESDETTSCPDTPDHGKLTFSSEDVPSDQKFHTEDWVRVSDFDVGTPTSTTTADSKVADYGVVALDCNYDGDVRGHDKLADWETVSRDMGGGVSSTEVVEILEGDDSVVDEESVSPSRGQGLSQLPHVDAENSEWLSEKQDEHKVALSSRTSEDQEKMSSSFEAGSQSKEEDQEAAASTVEFQENVHLCDSSEVTSLQQEHDNERQKSHMEVHPVKLQEQEEACSNNGNESLSEEQEEEDDHVTSPRQEDSKMIGHALEEDRSIQLMDAAISGMYESGDHSTEAVDVAPLEPQEDNVKGISEQESDEHDQLLDIAHSTELADLGKEEEKIIAQEEEDIGENISETIVDMLTSAGNLPQTTEHGEVEDLQKVAVEESPLIEEHSDAPDAMVSEVAKPIIRAQGSGQFSVSNEDSFADAIPREYENMRLSEDLSTTAEVEKMSHLDTHDQEQETLSLLDTPSDKILQTEEWVKISNFDVGTPTSTTADSRADYDIAAEKSYGDGKGHDKLADWETVSRDTVGASSSIEEVEESLEGDHSALDESVSSSQGQGLELPHVDKGDLERLSGKEDDRERVNLSSQSLSEISENKEKISNCSVAGSPGKEEDQESAPTLEFQEHNQESSSPEVPLQPDHDNEEEISSMDVQSQTLQVQQEPEEEHHVTNSTQDNNMILSNFLEEGESMQAVNTTICGVDESVDQSAEPADYALHEPQEDNMQGVSEQENDELVDIAQTTQLANLGKQEEKIIAQEEEDLGKNILEPLANVLASAETSSETLQLGEVEDLQNVPVEETPLVQDSSLGAVVSEEAEPCSRGRESALVEQSSGANADSFSEAIPVEDACSLEDLSTAGHTSQIDAPLAETENYDLIQSKTAAGPKLPTNLSMARTDGAELGTGLSIGGSGSSPEDLLHYNSPRKSVEQVRSNERWDGSSEIRGCCEPVHWILVHIFGRQID
ncbi:unnamed protein product [Sphagnum balticum]